MSNIAPRVIQRRRKVQILRAAAAADQLFADSDNWSMLWTCEDASATAWTARVGAPLSTVNDQAVNGDTSDLDSAVIGGSRVDSAAVVVDNGTNGGWSSDGVEKSVVPAGGQLTMRACFYSDDLPSGDTIFWWASYFGGGDDWYMYFHHVSANFMQLQLGGSGSVVNAIAGISMSAWNLVDIFVNPGVGYDVRINGVETSTSSATTPDVSSNGLGGDVGVGCRHSNVGPAAGARILGVGVAPGNLGLARHQTDAEALGLYTP